MMNLYRVAVLNSHPDVFGIEGIKRSPGHFARKAGEMRRKGKEDEDMRKKK